MKNKFSIIVQGDVKKAQGLVEDALTAMWGHKESINYKGDKVYAPIRQTDGNADALSRESVQIKVEKLNNSQTIVKGLLLNIVDKDNWRYPYIEYVWEKCLTDFKDLIEQLKAS